MRGSTFDVIKTGLLSLQATLADHCNIGDDFRVRAVVYLDDLHINWVGWLFAPSAVDRRELV